jgi:predicted amidophosphoribosyltransferase
VRALLDLVVPAGCAACGKPGTVACSRCLVALTAAALPAWPTPSPAGLPPPYAVAPYADPTRALLLAYKERGLVALRAPLGAALAGAVQAALTAGAVDNQPVWLVPVPSSSAARRQRGDDVVLRLARVAAATARRDGRRLRVLPALRHGRSVRDSAGLSAGERSGNLVGALRLRAGAAARLAGTTVVVVDDLVTTGATLAECARVLRDAGAHVPAAAVVAATRRRTEMVPPGLHR